MKKRRFAGAIIVFAFFCLATPLYAALPWLHTDANLIKDPSGNTVVLRGIDIIDLGFLESWEGGAIAMINRLTNKSDPCGSSPGWYPKVIRINITPPDSVSGWPHPFSPDNNDLYNLLRTVVDYCKTKDMYAIIDWHYVANTYDHISSTNTFWAYMAPKFANDSHVMFELFNEPINNTFGTDTANWQSVRTDMQSWINLVRSYAPNNIILVAGPSYSQTIGPAAAYPVTGDNIVIVSHIYPLHWISYNASTVNNINTCLTRYPVFQSEWGFWNKPDDTIAYGAISTYGQPLADFREARKISNSAWVSSYDWSPCMFTGGSNYKLRIGQFEMGGFVKDTLYLRRNDNLPSAGNTIAPSAPTGLSATAGTSIVSLDWNNNSESDLYAYDIYRSTTSGSGYSKINLVRSKDSNYTDTNVINSTTYYYVVKAVDTNFNSSGYSSQVPATPIPGPGNATSPSPATGATGVSITTTLSWTAASGATSRDVYFGTVSPGTLKGNQTATTYNPGTLVNNTTYYWRIDEKKDGGTTTGDVWSFTTIPVAPGKATSPSPGNGTSNNTLTPTLIWTAGSGATSHDVYFGTASPGTLQGNQTAIGYSPGTLATSTTYYWRIDERNGGGTTTGDVWSFTTVPAAPGKATSPSPANAATGISISTILSWTAGSGATFRNVYFGTASSPPLVSSNQSGTTYSPGTLLNNTTYNWRIDEKNNGGTTTGDVWSFTTAPAASGKATSPSPANAATGISTSTTLIWTAGSGATSHLVYFGTTSPGTYQGEQAGITFGTGTMANGTTYYWRIDEKNAGGTTTGDVWSFTTLIMAPGKATSPSPSNAAADVSTTTTLIWTAGSGATSHLVYFGTTSPGTYQGEQAGTTFDTGTIANGMTYYWHIDEKNTGGTTTGDIWSFTTIVAAPGKATSPSPADAAADINIATTLSWTAGSDAISHDVYFGTVSPGAFQGNQAGTTFDIGTMANNTTYYWRIDEKNSGGTTTGDVWSFTTVSATPAAPAGLTATAGIGTVSLDWNDNNESYLGGYNVYRSTTSGSDYIKLNGTLLSSSNYTDDSVANGTIYYYVVTAVSTGSMESDYSNETSATPSNPSATGTGAILREWWSDISGTEVNDLTSDVNYPDNSTGRELLTKLEGPNDWADNYGTRIRGYVIPPADGDYTFWIVGSNSGELWLSTDNNSLNAALIAYIPDGSQSLPIALVANQMYYIEVLHKAGTGNDNISISWQGPTLSQQVIDGQYLSACCLDFRDFADLAEQWNRSDCNADNNWCSGEDRNRDGNVQIDDLKTFAEEWLTGL